MTAFHSNELAIESGALVVHVTDRLTLQTARAFSMPLIGSEHSLDGGRFERYREGVDTFPIKVGEMGWQMEMVFKRVVEWIAENCVGAWAFHCAHNYNRDTTFLTMFFEDECDAVMFRLSIVHQKSY